MSIAGKRSQLALLGRLGVAVLLGLALWNPGWRGTPAPVNAVVVLDESSSMGADRAAAAWQEAATILTGLPPGSRYSLVRFGLEPLLEAEDRPTTEPAGQPARPHRGALDATGTNIEAALRLAGRQLAGEMQPLLLLITDGGETAGDATAALARFRAMGLPVPFLLSPPPASAGPDAAIIAVDAPYEVPFGAEVTIVLDVFSNRDGPAEIRVRQALGPATGIEVELAKDRVSRVRVPVGFDVPGFRELEFAVSMPGDVDPANDRRRAVVNVAGPTTTLYVTVRPTAALAESLAAGGWALDIVRPEHVPQILPQLPNPATVVLDDVAITDMPEPAWLALTESVRTRGTGLIVLGGRRSFGAGGYLDSTLEAALPVTSESGTPLSPAAVLFVVDKSGSMGRGPPDGAPFGLAKAAVLAAARLLGDGDHSGVIAFDVDPETWLPLADHADPAASILEAWRDAPAGGTRIAPALAAAAGQLGGAGPDQRLLVLVTDGFAVEDDYSAVLAQIDEFQIDVIALAIGDEPAFDVLERLTSKNDGLLLRVADVAMLPHLASGAVGARRLTHDAAVTRPREERRLPFLPGAGRSWPDLDGYMVTRERANARVYLRSERGDPLLADFDFGLGRVVVLPAGLGDFAPDWFDWPEWPSFAGGLVEWAGNRWGDGRVFLRLVQAHGRPLLDIDALSSDGDWAGTDRATVRVSDPFGRIEVLQADATAPGQYRVELPLRHTGRHRATVQVGDVARTHEFLYEAPAELGAGALADQTLADWLAGDLVRPWQGADSMQTLAAVTRRPMRGALIALAALLYLGILLARQVRVFRDWREKLRGSGAATGLSGSRFRHPFTRSGVRSRRQRPAANSGRRPAVWEE